MVKKLGLCLFGSVVVCLDVCVVVYLFRQVGVGLFVCLNGWVSFFFVWIGGYLFGWVDVSLFVCLDG